jgi:hypothetical protein
VVRPSPPRLDQIVPGQQFSDEDLGGLEVESPHLHHDIEDVVGFAALAGAEGASLLAVPTPGRVIVDVIGIRALDMRPTLAPRIPSVSRISVSRPRAAARTASVATKRLLPLVGIVRRAAKRHGSSWRTVRQMVD